MITLISILGLIAGVGVSTWSQDGPDLKTYFKSYIGLSEKQIKAVRSGKGFAKTLPSRTPAEIFVFGAIYIHARPYPRARKRQK